MEAGANGHETRTGGVLARIAPPWAPHGCMVFGAGLYWGSVLLQTGGNASFGSSSALAEAFTASELGIVTDLVFLLTMTLVSAFPRWFSTARGQKALAIGTVVGAATSIVLAHPLAASSLAIAMIALVVQYIGSACTVMFWGLCFTCLEKREAEKIALESMLLAFAFFITCSALVADGTPQAYATRIALILSVSPFLLGQFRIEPVTRDDARPNKRILLPFYGSRVFFGVCMGAATFLCGMAAREAGECSPAICLALLAAIGIFVWYRHSKGNNDLSLLRFAPVTVSGMIVAPYLGTESLYDIVCRCSPAVIWAGWMTLHAIQLSAIKEESGVGDAMLSFTEKVAFMGPTVLTLALLGMLSKSTPLLNLGEETLYLALGAVVFFDVYVCLDLLNRVADGKESARIVDNAMELSDQRNEPVYELIAERYDLTPRELDVMRLLARGLTRPAISEELCVSEGTVRTHMNHIYKKLGIHSRDDLLALVDQEARSHVAQPPGGR